MKLIGKHIKSARIEKRIDLIKISNELNIGVKILEDIENDHFPNYINKVFIIGHIRAYAKFLELNDSELISDFKIQISYKKEGIEKKISKPLDKFNFSLYSRSLSFTSIFIVATSFYFLFIKPNNLSNQYAMTPDVPENLQYILEEAEMDLGLSIKENKTSSSSAIASFPNNKDISSVTETITLKFLNSTWIQIKDNDNQIIMSKLMNIGDEYSYKISQNLNLTAGNAGNIIISIDNIVRGRAGKLGQVLESLIIDSNFSN